MKPSYLAEELASATAQPVVLDEVLLGGMSSSMQPPRTRYMT
jgi:hypothetical protein